MIADPPPAIHIHVAASGGDAATLETAQALVRAALAARRAPVTVSVAAGIYHLQAPLVFTPADSGTAQAPVRWQADGEVVISGGTRLEVEWMPYRDGILMASTPPGLAIDQLFVDGLRQPMARYPDFDPAATPYNGASADAFSPERAARWADPRGGYVHAMHKQRWGGYHYRIIGKNAAHEVQLEGGWQNNRQMGMHAKHRFVENIFEELDAPGEWFHDAATGTLYCLPPVGVDLGKADLDVVRLAHLVEFRGDQAAPVRHLELDGFRFRHAARTFMDTREPLLRSDWTIYRGGALVLTGSEDCTIRNCTFDQLGGNAIFLSNYNRRALIAGCHIHGAGASGVCFVGNPASVRNPLFEYGQQQRLQDIDPTPGPIGGDFPQDCTVTDSLIHGIGVVEKQAAGVQISMASRITVSHCSIYEVGRAGININEGTFGGHLIEGCDVFDTVLETHDHGSFNSWGRDRYWNLQGAEPEQLPALALLDAVEPTTIRDSRWRCDHGWDIDLDDGSSNYVITGNLMLGRGLKLREGFRRIVRNNVAPHGTLHPHVWYRHSGDVVTGNIWGRPYQPVRVKDWGQEVDRNFFLSAEALTATQALGIEANSQSGDAGFVDPGSGDYRVRAGSPAAAVGFIGLAMHRFGVRSPRLQALARTPFSDPPPAPEAAPVPAATPALVRWQGALLRGIVGEEYSAFGTAQEDGGLCLIEVLPGSPADQAGLRANDLISAIDDLPMKGTGDLAAVKPAGSHQVRFVRDQQARTTSLAAGASP